MRRTTTHHRSRAWLASALVLSLVLSLIPSALWPCRAAEIVSKANLNGDHLGPPILLDQNGQVISLTTTQSGSSALTNNSDPTYLAYQVLGEQALRKGFPTIASGSAGAGQTGTGPLDLAASVKARLNQTLAKDGEVAVTAGQSTYVVKPLSSLLNAPVSASGTILAWISSQRTTGDSSATTVAAAPIEAQSLIPSAITDPITDSKLVKDLENLFDLKSGKLVNWNQQSLNALESDLGINPPKDVTTKAVTKSSKAVTEAQVINGASTGGTPQPAPVPEPGTLVIFSLVAAALAVRQIRSRRVAGPSTR